MARERKSFDVDDGVVDAAEAHVQTSLDNEVGGVLVGSIDSGRAHVIAAIPALQAVGKRAQVTFTHEVWDEVLTKAEQEHPGSRIVGWYHSHPGFGIFLSEYDIFIHDNFFADPAMVALVVDPRSGELGWFGWVDGKVEQLGETVQSAPPRPVPASPTVVVDARRTRVARAALAAAAAVIVGLVAGYLIGLNAGEDGTASPPARGPDPGLETQVERLERELAEAERRASEAEGALQDAGAFLYTVQRDDGYIAIAEKFYGDGDAWELIRDANPDVGNKLQPGIQIRIPPMPDADRANE